MLPLIPSRLVSRELLELKARQPSVELSKSPRRCLLRKVQVLSGRVSPLELPESPQVSGREAKRKKIASLKSCCHPIPGQAVVFTIYEKVKGIIEDAKHGEFSLSDTRSDE